MDYDLTDQEKRDYYLEMANKFNVKLALFKTLLHDVDGTYLNLLNKKLVDSNEKHFIDVNVIYFDPSLLKDIERHERDQIKMTYMEMLDLYLVWLAKASTMLHTNANRFDKNKSIKTHINDVMPKLLKYANKIDALLTKEQARHLQYQPNPEE